MTGPTLSDDKPAEVEEFSSDVRLAISNDTLADMVEIVLRLDNVPIEDESTSNPGLIIGDPAGFALLNEGQAPPHNRSLLLINDEADIPEGMEYLLVPHHGDDHDLDPGLLIRKVREMLSGRKPSIEKNPVTNLPGAAAFEAELRERISTGERFGVVFADLNQFKNYNKAYSYSRGDEMLCSVGELMSEILNRYPHPQNFLSHLGNDDFALISSEKHAPVIAEEIVDRFDAMVSEFYDVSDLTRGSVLITDRKARESECPLVTIALAVILSSRNALEHAAEALDIADELLEYLKSRDVTESCCIVERKSAE